LPLAVVDPEQREGPSLNASRKPRAECEAIDYSSDGCASELVAQPFFARIGARTAPGRMAGLMA
jgi:hypothetical protein